MKKSPLCLLALGLSLTLLVSCTAAPTGGSTPPATGSPSASLPATQPPVETGTSAPPSETASDAPAEKGAALLTAFTTTDLDGNEVTETLLSDKALTMVNVWATYCSPCLREMPDLGEIHAEYADKSFQVVGLVSDALNRDGSLSQSQLDLAKEIVLETGADYPHIVPSEDLYGILQQVTVVPLTFFVDSEGNQVGSAYAAAKSKDAWLEIIDPLLEEVGA